MNKDIRESAQALKQHFLENARPLVDEYIGAALGTAKLSSNNAGAREECWDLLKKLMLQSSDKLDIQIESARDVLNAVSNGKCTIEEGEQLLKMYKQLKEIDTMGILSDSGSGGLTINILSSSIPAQLDIPRQNVLDYAETE